MELPLFEISNGPCPYLQGREWLSQVIYTRQIDGYIYELLIDQGFRRSGEYFYKNNCPGCAHCVPIRIPAGQFAPSKSQRKLWNKNQDLDIQITGLSFREEDFQLYRSFTQQRYGSQSTLEEYKSFLTSSPVETVIIRYFLEEQLLGVGWLDVLENSLSSVYFAFDPQHSKRSLGTYSVLKELELCRQFHKKYLHLGFWVDGNQAMSYKNRFKPHQLLHKGQWLSPEQFIEITGANPQEET